MLSLTDRDFSRALWKSTTECLVVFPGGIVPWMVPGGADITRDFKVQLRKDFLD